MILVQLIIGLFSNRAYRYHSPAHPTHTHTLPKALHCAQYLSVCNPKLAVRLPITLTKPRKRLHIIFPSSFPSPVGYTRHDSHVTQHGTVQKSHVSHMYLNRFFQLINFPNLLEPSFPLLPLPPLVFPSCPNTKTWVKGGRWKNKIK